MVNFPLDGTSLVWSFQASVTSAHFCLILLPIAILSSFPLSCLLCSMILLFFCLGPFSRCTLLICTLYFERAC